MTIDLKSLPDRPLIDSGILTRAMGDMPPDANTQVCREFYEAMLGSGGTVLIAAPTLAEVMRANSNRALPRTLGIEIVSFDDLAAMSLGRTFPIEVLKSINTPHGTLTHLKYDALIVACAVRHRAECIVALDGDIHRLAEVPGIDCYYPGHFQSAQHALPLGLPTVGTATSKSPPPDPEE